MHLVEMATFLKDYDMYVPSAAGWDVGLHAQTGHPCAVVQYKFEPRVGTAPGGGGRGAAPPSAADTFNTMPTCAVLAGNLFNDDLILSVAHAFQVNTDFHTHHPTL